MNRVDVLIDIYKSALQNDRVLLCEKDSSYYPPIYNVSICGREMLSATYHGIILYKDVSKIKELVLRTYTMRVGEEPFLKHQKRSTTMCYQTFNLK